MHQTRAESKRTLVKSLPELWELIDDEEMMRHCAGELGPDSEPIRVLGRERGERLRWSGGDVVLDVTLEEKGFGTEVRIRAEQASRSSPDSLERILDQLAAPQRQPFSAP